MEVHFFIKHVSTYVTASEVIGTYFFAECEFIVNHVVLEMERFLPGKFEEILNDTNIDASCLHLIPRISTDSLLRAKNNRRRAGGCK